MVLSLASGSLIGMLSLGTSLLGDVGDAAAHVVVGLFGSVVAWLFVLELGRVSIVVARGRSFTTWRAIGDIVIAVVACGVLGAANEAGGIVGAAAMTIATPWTIAFVCGLGVAFLGILIRAASRRAPLLTATPRREERIRARHPTIDMPVQAAKLIGVADDALRLRTRYRAPSMSLLDQTIDEQAQVDPTEATRLVRALADFDIAVTLVGTCVGPTVMTYEATLAAGTKLSRVQSLEQDLTIACGKPVRVVRSSHGCIGLELPRDRRAHVGLRELLTHASFDAQRMTLPLALGRDVRGAPVAIDLAAMPHLLVAGATGSGKSVAMNAMLASLLFARRPDEMRLVLIDPKQVEFAPYANIPHLLEPVVTEMTRAAETLSSLVEEMERRYALLAEARCRSLMAFNERYPASRLPYVVVAIDEFADLLTSQGKPVESLVLRLAQKGRACGVHMIIATQRPSVRVVSGSIKANIPARICYRVAQGVDSRVMLDEQGAEHLLGLGDALVRLPGDDGFKRVQSALIHEHEIDALTQDIGAANVPVALSCSSDGACRGVSCGEHRFRSYRLDN
jgi:S-DNA-T family DNA segregation ATPase FtsK/SpoIIIE